MIYDGREYVLELYIDRENDYDIVGRYFTTEEFERAVSETIPKLKEGEKLNGAVGYPPEFPEDELSALLDLYDIPSWTIDEEYWKLVFEPVELLAVPLYPEKAQKKVCKKGNKPSSSFYVYLCDSCGGHPGTCKCSDGWSFKKRKASKNQFEEYISTVVFELEEQSYVCQDCFLQLSDCVCENYPEQLVEIDTAILPIIRTLNAKGYFTVYCCSGHPADMDGKHHMHAHIRWFAEYNLSMPEGWITEKDGFSTYRYFSVTASEFISERKKVMNTLLQWAENLPNHSERIIYTHKR